MTSVKTEYVKDRDYKSKAKGDAWYKLEEEAQYAEIFSLVDKIDKEQSYQSTMNMKYARLYSNLEVLGMSVYKTGTQENVTSDTVVSGKVTYNLIKSCIDSVCSKIAKNKPKPQFLTSGGDYSMRARAEKLTKYIEGVFYGMDYYDKSANIFRDACVFGTGILKFYKCNGEIKAERVLSEELKVDNNDGLYGKPKSLFQVKQINRDILMEKYPDHRASIISAQSSTPDNSNVDLIKVVEAWYLGENGKHTICIDNKTLLSEEWEKDFFPFIFFRWSDRLTGFFGSGIAEELAGTQFEINRMLKNIQLALKNVAIPRIAVQSNSKVNVQHLTNEIASIFTYQGGTTPPQFFTPTAMNAEVYNHLKWLIQSGYEKVGVSQLSASSKKPSGLDAAVAIREFNDIETERFMLVAQRYEALALQASKIIIELSKDLFAEDNKLKVKVPSKDFIESISWKDVNLDEDKYIMKSYPSSLLPNTPSGRMQRIEELVKVGWINKEQALELADFPDLQQFNNLETSNNTLINKYISKMLESGEYMPPEPQMDLVSASSIAHRHYLLSRLNDVKEDKLELLIRFIDDSDRLQKIKMSQIAPPQQDISGPQEMAGALPPEDIV